MDPLPPDPYLALGVPRNATQQVIKTAYRKAALKYHPDKAPDKGELFHSIQTAYEVIGEEENRQKYDAEYRLQQLRQDAWTGRGPTVEVRTAAFDMRSSPNPDAQFTARGPPRYETSERRPTNAYFGMPNSTPRAAHDDASDYFGARPTSRKGDNLGRRASQTVRTPREEEKREKERTSSAAKVRADTKKQREKERGFDRRAKAASIISLDSDEESDPVRRPDVQYAYVRKKEPRRDEFEDRRSREHEFARTSSVRDYIARSKVDGPVERVYTRSSRDELLEEIRARPEVRRSPSKPKEKERPTETKRTSSRKTSGRRSPSPTDVRERKAPPPLFTASSSPAGLKIPSPDSTSRRTRTSDEYHVAEDRVPPQFRRSETAPSKASVRSRRDGDTTPIISSNLRQETTVNDSGYSTGNSPNEDQAGSKPQRRSPDYDGIQFVYREPGRVTRSPSPIRERSSTKDRDRPSKAPPVSRSASYAQYDAVRKDDRPVSLPSSRRGSLQREDSDRRRSVEPEELRKRPSLQRSDSQRGSRRVPDLTRGATMPLHLRTGSGIADAKDRDRYLFNEIRQTSSPVDFRPVDFRGVDDDEERPRRSSPYDDGGRASRRYLQEVDSGYGSYYPHGIRRASEDNSQGQMAEAKRYMNVRRQETWA